MLKPGMVVVAHPDIPDPDFERSVIVIVAASDQFVMGLNIASHFSEPGPSGPIHLGGPVENFEVYVICPVHPDSACRIGDSNYEFHVLDPGTASKLLASKSDQHMVFMDYAGWTNGGLEENIAAGYFRLARVSLDQLMSLPIADRWRSALNSALD